MSMLGLPSENERVALTSDAIMARVLEKCGLARVRPASVVLRASARRPNGLDDLANLGPVEVRGRLLAAEKDVEQIVVGELHQQAQALGVGFAHRLGAREDALEQEVVLEQPAPAAPAQFAQRALVDRAA